MKSFKILMVTSIFWGSILPLFLPLVINIGPLRTVATSVNDVKEIAYSNLANYEALIHFHTNGELILLWLKFFLVFSFVFFIVCGTYVLIERQKC